MEDNINQQLHDAAVQGDLTLLQALLIKDPLLIHRSTTALHVACKFGHVQFAWELLRINPSLAEEVDPSTKSSPLHLASRYGHLELVKGLVSVSPSTCFARDMDGMNPTHVAVVKGQLHVLDELLAFVPAAARERVGPVVGGTRETICHLCVKFNQEEALKLIVNRVGDAEMLNAADDEGNTVLHLAVANKQPEIVRFLLGTGRVNHNTYNAKGLTAIDIFNQSHKDPNNDHKVRLTLKQFKVLPSKDIKQEKEKDNHFNWLENQRSALMVVSSLIANMAFQAALSPPGGSSQGQDPPNSTTTLKLGSPVMAQNKILYNIFLVLNTTGLVASMSSILLLISGLPCRRFFIAFIMVTMWVAITAMTSAYWISLNALAPDEDKRIVNHVIGYSLGVWLIVTGLLLLGHVVWWTMRFLKFLGRLLKKFFGYCFHRL